MIDHKFLRAPMNANYYHNISDNIKLHSYFIAIMSDSSHQEGDEKKSELRIKN